MDFFSSVLSITYFI